MRVELIPGGGPLYGLLKQSQTLLDVLELRVGKAEIRGDGGQVDGEVMASANLERLLEQLRGPLGISAQEVRHPRSAVRPEGRVRMLAFLGQGDRFPGQAKGLSELPRLGQALRGARARDRREARRPPARRDRWPAPSPRATDARGPDT